MNQDQFNTAVQAVDKASKFKTLKITTIFRKTIVETYKGLQENRYETMFNFIPDQDEIVTLVGGGDSTEVYLNTRLSREMLVSAMLSRAGKEDFAVLNYSKMWPMMARLYNRVMTLTVVQRETILSKLANYKYDYPVVLEMYNGDFSNI